MASIFSCVALLQRVLQCVAVCVFQFFCRGAVQSLGERNFVGYPHLMAATHTATHSATHTAKHSATYNATHAATHTHVGGALCVHFLGAQNVV